MHRVRHVHCTNANDWSRPHGEKQYSEWVFSARSICLVAHRFRINEARMTSEEICLGQLVERFSQLWDAPC